MKIAIDCRFIGKSGIGTYIENIVSSLLEKHAENTYLLLTNTKLPQYSEYSNVEFQVCSYRPFSFKELFLLDCRKINECDVYFTPYINIPLGIKIPIFSTIHDVIFLDEPSLTTRIGKILRWCFYKMAIMRSVKIFTVSEFSKSRIKAHFNTHKDIVVTYSAISSYVKCAVKNEISKNDRFVFIGNVKQHKGIDILLKAFEFAQSRGMNSDLYIVGEKNNFRTMDKHIADFLNNPKIHFTGFVSNKELVAILQSSKALVLPSRYEGLGLPPMEALYLGTNAIISDIPVFKEIYHDLPVKYFKSEDVFSLSECLMGEFEKINVQNVRHIIDSKYNFSIIVDKILKEILSVNDYS